MGVSIRRVDLYRLSRSFMPEQLTIRAREKGELQAQKPEWGFRVVLDLH